MASAASSAAAAAAATGSNNASAGNNNDSGAGQQQQQQHNPRPPDLNSLKIRTKSIEQTLIPLVTQVGRNPISPIRNRNGQIKPIVKRGEVEMAIVTIGWTRPPWQRSTLALRAFVWWDGRVVYL